MIDPDKSATGGNELSGGVGQTAEFSASGRRPGRAFIRPSLMCIPQAQVGEKLADALRVVHSAIDNLKQLDPLPKPGNVSAKILTYFPGWRRHWMSIRVLRKRGGLDLVPYDFALPADESANDEDADTRPSKKRKHDDQAAEFQRACGAAYGGSRRGARGPAGDVRETSTWSEPVVISSDELSSGDDAHSPADEMADMNPPRA